MAALVDILLHIASAAALSATLVTVSYFVETVTYCALQWLEDQGILERLAPQMEIPDSSKHYRLQTAASFFLSSWGVLLVALHPSVYGPLLATAKPSWNWLEIAATCLVGVAVHDVWFWAIHRGLHRNKWLYSRIHSTHHKLGADVNVFSTADMDALEAFSMGFGFYAAVLLFYVKIGYWNPIAYTFLVLLEANMNMMGHCGYRQPLWLALIQSWGICLIPGAAHAKTHYIHHIDPRCNRALYFSWCVVINAFALFIIIFGVLKSRPLHIANTPKASFWWDRVDGTWRDKHPYIKEFTPEQQWEYETRVFRFLGSKAKQLLVGHIKSA